MSDTDFQTQTRVKNDIMKWVEQYDGHPMVSEPQAKPYDKWLSFIHDDLGYMGSITAREAYICNIGFPILTLETTDVLVEFLANRTVVDIGCGSGFITFNLLIRGISVTAVDSYVTEYINGNWKSNGKLHTDVVEADAVDYIKSTAVDVVIMSWPDHRSTVSSEVAKAMTTGQYLIYQGEGGSSGGCTGCPEFHEMLDDAKQWEQLSDVENRLNTHHLQWDRMHDSWFVYKKM